MKRRWSFLMCGKVVLILAVFTTMSSGLAHGRVSNYAFLPLAVRNHPGLVGPTPTPIPVGEWPIVGFGYIDGGPLVFALQYLLQAEGYSVAADGVFGPQTDSAVKSFQEAAEVPVDGLVGPITWPELIQVHTLSTGTTGPDVRAVQHLLRHKHGYVAVVVDGIFGPSTRSAVLDLQAKHGLTADGIVGPNTWKALVAG